MPVSFSLAVEFGQFVLLKHLIACGDTSVPMQTPVRKIILS